MSSSSQDFARYANAERHLCDEAAPLLATIIRDIESRVGIRIAEVRVTVDRVDSDSGSIVANCTIVRANDAPATRGSALPGGADLSPA
jgi:hypothetical protein